MTHHGKAAVEFGPGGQLLGRSDVCDGKWHHLVAVYDATTNTRHLYVNGRHEGQDTSKPEFQENDNYLYIGRRPGTDYFFKGAVNDVRIYARALNEEEVKILFNVSR